MALHVEDDMEEGTSLPGSPCEPNTTVNSLARAFLLDTNSEWITVATGNAVPELSEDGRSLTLSLHEEHDSSMVLFSTTFHKDQDVVRQQGAKSPFVLCPLMLCSHRCNLDLGRRFRCCP